MAASPSDSPVILSPSGRPARDLFTAPAQPQAQGFYWSGGTSYFAAQQSEARGQFILPPKRAEDALNSTDRTIIALKSRLLAENYGPGAALGHLATMIGSLKPQSMTSDRAWGIMAEEYFDRVTNSQLTFDAGGRFTLATYQPMTTYRRFLDGDMFTALTRSNSGHARVIGYEGLCCEAGKDQKAPEWVDGVKCDTRTRFPLAYSIAIPGEKGKVEHHVFNAAHVIHHMTNRTLSGRRGVPALAHCLNDFHDIIETKGFQKQMIKVASLVGLTRKTDPLAAGMNPFNLGVGAPLQQSPYQPPTASSPISTLPVPTLKFEEAVEGGLMGTVPFDVVHDERPHPNGEAFKASLLREAANGLGFPHQLLYFMDDPGGAWTRTLLEMAAQCIISHHKTHLAPMVRRLWAYVISVGIEIGEVPEPTKADWMKIRLTPPRMPTADLGRMGRLMIELRNGLQTSFSRLYEELGLDYESELDQCAAEFRMLMDLEKKYGIPAGSMTHALFADDPALAPDPTPVPEPGAAAA